MATNKKKATAEAKAEATSAIDTIRSNVTERATKVRETMTDGIENVRGTAGLTAGAAVDFGKAYYSGLSVLGQTLYGFGQEFYGEVTEHAQKTMGAKSLTDVAGLQAAFLQTRVETSAAHSKEFVDVAREQAEATLKPVIELLDGKRAA
ncbi:MAG: phasin family protein [Pseudomonadota bacterium]